MEDANVSGGEQQGLAALRRRVAELEKSEAEIKSKFEILSEAAERLRTFFENAEDIIWVHDLQGNLTSVNKKTEMTTGYAGDELSKMNIFQLVVPAYTRLAKEMLERKAQGVVSRTTYEAEILTKEGRAVPVEINSQLLMKQGKPDEVWAILRNITVRKLAERALAESENKYRSLMNYATDAIVLLTLKGRVVEVNEKAEALLGYSKGKLLNAKFADLHPESEIPGVIAAFHEIVKQGSGFLKDVRYIAKSGRLIPADVSMGVVEYAGKKLVQAFIRDISEHKRREDIIARQAQEIMEISIPVFQVWEGVVAAPLIGTLDSQRAEQFTERLLNKIVEWNSPVALIDITGVPAIDTKTAQHLIDTISAIRLLGGKAILTGVRPAIAQVLVHLGIDLSDVITRASFAAGLRVALEVLDLQLINKNKK